MLERLEAPISLTSNADKVKALGMDEGGEQLLTLMRDRCGLDSLAGLDILDVGCGVRFTQAIINRRIPIGTYTGIDVWREVIDFLSTQVEPSDERFSYAHWDARNAMYNDSGSIALAEADLPFSGPFDLICMFSVVTHLDSDDAGAMFRLLRPHVRPDGHLFFSAFVGEGVDRYEDRSPAGNPPLSWAFYDLDFLSSLVTSAGWEIESIHEPLDPIIQTHFVCRPGEGALN